ncbi:23S rRNA (adenine(2503)-C(2))-methyltransferase RlmN [Candidatus Avelusimicrobium faecicola]|uniref:23S rRNA (adenine(2503)-C(2))-methyltransferase RlmN n=1 Tax=Candidatus Avelusimicrobium faecicola TaxID=3416205 RepID=UPI002A7787E9|nr:23S rRNA (adenine(2503)-C(2))-methyltransferase RlmN [Spirochaetota bacterium]MDY2940496.1 23S rRNA (adenine(2503)-C(2))-methyltransferase RlmN [Elusimicrobiaceae bacterium]
MNFESVKEYIKSAGLPNFRIAQVRDAVYKHGITSWEEATSLPAQIRRDLAEKYPILSFKVSKMVFSKADKAAKALLTLQDGRQIETVLLKPQDTWSVCVSSQVGCPLHCSFCSTGKMGFRRDLTDEEIADQVLMWYQYVRKEKLGERISSVVFMGMGEPLLNYLNVVKAAQTLSNPDYLNIGARHISVSTAGIADKLHKLAVDLPQANLAVSLHNADDSERSKLMPVNRRFNLEELQKAVEEYIAMTGRQVFLEYAVLENVNSRPEHIRKLAKWIYGIKDNYLIHVNLIACNLGRGMKTDDKVVKDFAAAVKAMGIGVTIRKSMGNDVLAACGQLAANK